MSRRPCMWVHFTYDCLTAVTLGCQEEPPVSKTSCSSACCYLHCLHRPDGFPVLMASYLGSFSLIFCGRLSWMPVDHRLLSSNSTHLI